MEMGYIRKVQNIILWRFLELVRYVFNEDSLGILDPASGWTRRFLESLSKPISLKFYDAKE